MSTAGGSHRTWSFGDFSLDIDRGCLLHNGQAVKLRPQSFEVLSYLVQHHGILVTKKDLQNAIWGNKAVTDDSLTHCLIDIRKVLGDDAHNLIRTVPRRGFIFEMDVEEKSGDQGSSPLVSVKRWRLVAAVAIVFGILGLWFGVTDTRDELATPPAVVEVSPQSIAVLPFTDMSESQDQRYFAHGMSEEIISLLAQIHGLQVTARTSSFSFENQGMDVADIATRLKVRYLLEGSIRKSGERIRVTAQLVDGTSMMHLWSETYNRESGDAIDVQREIAEAVASALKTTLISEIRSPDPSPAYDLYLQGKFIYNRRGPGDVQTARAYFLEGVDIDPDFAPTWAGLAGVYLVLLSTGEIEVESGLRLLREAAETAVTLDPDLVEAEIRLSQAYFLGGDRVRGRQLFEQALSKHPNHLLALGLAAGVAAENGDLTQAINLQRRAILVDPLNAISHHNLASYLTAAGRYDEAIVANRRKSNLNPASIEETDAQLAQLYILQGRYQDALAIIQQCPASQVKDQGLALVYVGMGRSSDATGPINRLIAANNLNSAIRLAEIYAHSGSYEASFERLQSVHDAIEAGIDQHEANEYLIHIFYSPFLRPLHADRRWAEWMDDARS
ncbi:MAG: winged helix-turn-helix domain-containing protein [Proteobacteria bacterium]|nr:winged helix-turn-helix domain-containing protein [Pseudomonadota bacterium]